jgi:hypothetical protein
MLTKTEKLSLLRGAIYAPDFRDKRQQQKWYATVKAHKDSILVRYGNHDLFKEAATLWLTADNSQLVSNEDIQLMKINVFRMTSK